MKRVPWLLVLALFLVACRSDVEPIVLDLTKGPQTLAAAPARDPIVRVSGPSTVYVQQNRRPRVFIVWPHQRAGELTVPLRAVDNGSGPLIIGVRSRPAVEDDATITPDCVDCLDCFDRCCMENYD